MAELDKLNLNKRIASLEKTLNDIDDAARMSDQERLSAYGTQGFPLVTAHALELLADIKMYAGRLK